MQHTWQRVRLLVVERSSLSQDVAVGTHWLLLLPWRLRLSLLLLVIAAIVAAAVVAIGAATAAAAAVAAVVIAAVVVGCCCCDWLIAAVAMFDPNPLALEQDWLNRMWASFAP